MNRGEAIGQFEADYGAKYPKSIASLRRDEAELLTFFDFPREHWSIMFTDIVGYTALIARDEQAGEPAPFVTRWRSRTVAKGDSITLPVKVQWYREAWWVMTHANGKRWRKRVGRTKTHKRESEEIARKINAALALGTFSPKQDPPSSALFGERLERWHSSYSPTFKHSFRISSRSVIEKNTIPTFGRTPIDEITKDDLLRYIAAKLEAGQAPATILKALSTMRRVFNLAIEDGLIARNPAARIGKLIRQVEGSHARETKQVEAWTKEEAETLLAVAQEHEPRFCPALLTLLSTGIRRGEVLGLQWQDVNFETSEITVRRAIVRGRVTTPKNRKGRGLVIPQTLASVLRELLRERRREALSRGWREVPEWIFCSTAGGPIEERNFERSWYRVRRRAQKLGVRPFRLHSTRHTFATLALASGKNIRWVADVLGHASPELTLRTYTHSLWSRDDDLGFAEFGSPNDRGRPYTAPSPERPVRREPRGADKPPPEQGKPSWARQDSNLRPAPCKGAALPLSYPPARLAAARALARECVLPAQLTPPGASSS